MRKINFLISIPVFAFLAMVFSGCASVPEIGAAKPIQGIPGIYHRVEKGQTLWRLSKIYGLDLDELVSINRISDSSNIEAGQLIFIPRRQKQQVEFNQGAVEDFIWPATGRVISRFQEADHDMINKGINIQVSRGADILASRSGKVIFYSPNFKGFGKTIIIDHHDGFLTVYARNSEVLARLGERVQKGAVIARAGSAGRDKNIYLHFEIRKNYVPQNPYFYLP